MNTPVKTSYDKTIVIAGRDYTREQRMQKRWEEGFVEGAVPNSLTTVFEYDMRGIEAITLIIKVYVAEGGTASDVNLIINEYAYYNEDDTTHEAIPYTADSETLSDGSIKKIVISEPIAKLEISMSATGDMNYTIDYIVRW